MSKLLTAPRIPKVQAEPKKKIKRVKKEVTDDSPKVKYTLISETSKRKVNTLFEVYKENPHNARVLFFNGERGAYYFIRTCLFEFNETDFEICKFQTTFGISISNRIYSSQKKIESISFRKGKFWHITSDIGRNGRFSGTKTIKPLTFYGLKQFVGEAEGVSKFNYENPTESKILSFLVPRFGWIRMLYDCPIGNGVVLSKALSKKMFGMKDIYRHMMHVPPNIAAMIIGSKAFAHLRERDGKAFVAWRELRKVLEGVEHLTPDMLESHIFMDTCRMAKTLGRTINCRWGAKRLKEEHDNWATEITNTILSCDKPYSLNIRPVFKEFAEFSGFTLMSTNTEMLEEGKKQNHCVGTYINKVNKGDCAIYHVNGFTLEVRIKNFNKERLTRQLRIEKEANNQRHQANTLNFFKFTVDGIEGIYVDGINDGHDKCLVNAQFRGKYNKDAPIELVNHVNKTLIDFVNQDGFKKAEAREKEFKPELTHGSASYFDDVAVRHVQPVDMELMF